MQNGTYPWVSSSSLGQKSWPPGYQASLTDLFLKKNPLHFRTGISQLAAASSYIEKMSTLNDHVQKCPHPDAKDKPYPCEICQQYFSICNTLRSDCASGSAGNRPMGSTSPIGLPNSSHELKPLSLVPSGVPGDRLQLLPVSSSQAALQRSQRMSVNKQFACPMCHKFFTQKGNLKTHMMIHTGEKPYACQVCGKSFTQKGNVDTHMKIHTGEKEFGCDSCGKRFTQKGNLKTHIRSVHTKEKPFVCDICGKSFSQKGNMMTHLRTHNKDDRFPCTLCGKTFSQKGNLKTHMQRHTGQLPQRKAYGRGGPLNRPPSLSRHNPDSSIAHMSPFSLQSSPPMTQSSAIPLLSSSASSKNDKNLQSPLHHELSRSGGGLSMSFSDSDCKPCLNSPNSPSLMSNNLRPLHDSPDLHRHQLSSPSPSEDMSPLHHKILHSQNSHLSKQIPGELMPHGLIHSAMGPGGGSSNRISSPMSMGSHLGENESRSFYSAPPTPVSTPLSHASRWLPHGPSRPYDSFQHHSSLSSYNAISHHTTPLSRLSLFASSTHNLDIQQQQQQQQQNAPPPQQQTQQQQTQTQQQQQSSATESEKQPTHTIHHHDSQYHQSGGETNPDFSQLLD